MTYGAVPVLRTYESRRRKPARIGVILAVLSIFGMVSLPSAWHWLGGGPRPAREAIVGLILLLCLPWGLWIVVQAWRNVPRLTLTADGIELRRHFGIVRASWMSLGPFEIAPRARWPFGLFAATASARLAVPGGGENPPGAQRLVLPDAFRTPLAAIVGELNQARAFARGEAAAPLPPPEIRPEFVFAGARWPWVTGGIVAVLIAVFAAEQAFAVSPGGRGLAASVSTLIALGGLSRAAILDHGEWYRLFTAPLLHGNIDHLLGNGVALLLGGWRLERLVGRAWFFAIFSLGAFGGALLSLAAQPASTVVSVGASGAIMALFAASFVASFRVPAGTKARQGLQLLALRILVPSLLPALATASAGQIDYAAHLGGTLTGAALGLVLLKDWRSAEQLPPLQPAVTAISVISLVLFAASAALAAVTYPKYDIAFIPGSAYPRSEYDIVTHAADLARRYPRDPRSHFLLGEALRSDHDDDGAEREFRTALAMTQALSAAVDWRLEYAARGDLAEFLAAHKRRDEARAVAQPLCAVAPGDPVIEALRRRVTPRHLCD